MLPPMPPSEWGSAPSPVLVGSGESSLYGCFPCFGAGRYVGFEPPIPPLIWATAHKSLERAARLAFRSALRAPE